jgi:hypothetical protein
MSAEEVARSSVLAATLPCETDVNQRAELYVSLTEVGDRIYK